MPTGNVSIRLSVQDAETVRTALEKLGNDGQAALKKLEVAGSKPSQGLVAVDKTASDLRSRLEGLAQTFGPVGTFFTALGPWGIAAAGAIGLVVAAFYELQQRANELGDRATQLRDFAEASGLSVSAAQAMSAEAAKVGIGNEQLAAGLQHLSAGLDAARHGTGTLYIELHRISPQLAHQVAMAKDVATAYDMIGRAIATAGDRATGAGIAQAAFGRNAALQGLLATQVFQSGGINTVASGFDQAGKSLDSGLIARLASLRAEIKEVEQENKDLSSSWFAETVLSRTLSLDQALQQSLLHMQEMEKVAASETWGEWAKHVLIRIGSLSGETGGNPELAEADDAARLRKYAQGPGLDAARKRLADQMGGRGGVKPGDINDYINGGFSALATPKPGAIGDWNKTLAASDEALKTLEKHMKALGAAATPAEKLTLEIGKLNNALAHGNITQAEYNRSLAAFKNAQEEAATAARERLGVASQEEIYASGLIKLQKDRADGFIRTDAEMVAAEQRLKLASEQSYKQEQVKNSAFKSLTQMGQGDNVNTSFDKLASGTLDKLGDTIQKIATNTNTAKENFRQFGLEAVNAIEQTIIKATILAPLARMITGSIGVGLPGTGGGNAWGFAEGGIMTSRGPLPLRRYAGGGVANSPQMAIFGEGSGPEAFVPLSGGAIPVRLSGGGGGPVIHNETHFHMSPPSGGGASEDSQRQQRRFMGQLRDTMTQVVDERIVRHLQSGGMLNQHT